MYVTESEIMGKYGLSQADKYTGESLTARNESTWGRLYTGKLVNGKNGTTDVNMPVEKFCGDYDSPISNTPQNIQENILDFPRREGLVQMTPYPSERTDYHENLQMYQTVDNSAAIKRHGWKQQDNFVGNRTTLVCGMTFSYIEIFLIIFLIIVIIYTISVRSDRDNLLRQNLMLYMNSKKE